MSTEEQAHFNVNFTEIGKFERMASRWWDRNGEFKPLHDINPLRCNYIDEASPVAGKRILDVGCGGGILSEALAQRGAQVTGIDMGKAPLEVARLHALESGLTITYTLSSAEAYAADHAAEFDVVCCMELLEHVPDTRSLVAACAQLVKPGGHVYFSTINRNPKSYVFAILGAEYVLKLLPRGTHDYQHFVKPAELAADIRAAQLQLENVCGIRYKPFTASYTLDAKDVDVNYLARAFKPE